MNKVILVRGIPGVGKSFWVKKHYPEATYCSSDLFFMVDGEYIFDMKKLGQSHSSCLNQFLWAMERRQETIVVDNTFSRRWEFQNYVFQACMNDYNVKIVELTCREDELPAIFRRGIHNVPEHIINDMHFRWEDGDRDGLSLPEYYGGQIENETVEVELPNCWRGFDELAVRNFFTDHTKLRGHIATIAKQIWFWERKDDVGNSIYAEIGWIELFDPETVVVQVLDAVGDEKEFKLYFPAEYVWKENWRKDYDKKRVRIA